MKKLIIIVEGDSEDEFVKRILVPFFISKGLPHYSIQSIIVTMKGGGHGYNNIEHLKNTIKPILHDRDKPIVTTLIDHYKLNSERKLPGYNNIARNLPINERLVKMEGLLNDAVQNIRKYEYFIPYIQRHEFETLLFANPEDGFDLEDEPIKRDIVDLCSSYDSIEDINSTPEGAPSVRLGAIYAKHGRKYNKGADAVDIAELTTMEKILEKCPRFKNWIDTLTGEVLKD
jgi:hypothetical protein